MTTEQKQDRKNLIKNGAAKMQNNKKRAEKDAQQDGYADAKADAYRLENEGKWDEAVIAWGLALDLAATEKDKKTAAGRKGAAKARASAAAKALEEQMAAQAEGERNSAKKQAAEAVDGPGLLPTQTWALREMAVQTQTTTPTEYTPAIINALGGTPLLTAYREVLGEEPKAKTPVPALRARIIAELKRLEAADAKDAAEAAAEAAKNECAVCDEPIDAHDPNDPHPSQDAEAAANESDDETRASTPEEMAAEAQDEAKEEKPATTRESRLPPAGTVIIKRDRTGAERCRCTILDGGKVEYARVEYKTLSAAGLAAMGDLGLAAKTCDGFAFWGLKKKEGGAAEPKGAKDVSLEPLQKAWERYIALADRMVTTAMNEEARTKVNEMLAKHAEAVMESIRSVTIEKTAEAQQEPEAQAQ